MASIGKVLIVGGGVAGMACAIQLRKAGIAVDLIDIDPDWRSYGAGITVTGPTLRALRTLGLLEEVTRHGATWNHARVHNQAGELLQIMNLPPLAEGLPATGAVMRPLLHRILSAKTLELGTQVRLGITLSSLRDLGNQA